MSLHLRRCLRRSIIAILAIAILLGLSGPALAGGYAVVRLDVVPGEILINTPWQFGFMVLQHDVAPTNDVTPIVRALHKETGEEVTATARQEGKVGHFVAKVTFPRAGEWKWAIEPQPFAETSFETLAVLESLGGPAYPANILAGSCTALGDAVFPLSDVEPQSTVDKSTQLPVAISVSTIDIALADLIADGHAIGIRTGDATFAPVACGEIEVAAGARPTELVLGLQGGAESENVGVAVLRDDGARTEVSLYLLTPGAGPAPLAATETATVEIVGSGTDAWKFVSTSQSIPAGATVVWVNDSDVAHTVTGDDLSFDDSGLIEPGQSFRQTFTDPGTYHYRCGPHPWMEGVIIVE